MFRAMLGVLLRLANRGVDVVRLDAVPFLWKRFGTNCQNQPEAHRILQALRALVRLAMPGVLAYVRRHPRSAPVVCLACFGDTGQRIAGDVVRRAG